MMIVPALIALGALLLLEKIVVPLGEKGQPTDGMPLEPHGRYKFVTVFREPVTPTAHAAIVSQLQGFLTDVRHYLENVHTVVVSGYYGGPPQIIKRAVEVSAPFGVYRQVVSAE